MSINLTPKVERPIQDWIDRGDYPDVDAVVDRALQVFEEQEQARFLRLCEVVRAGFASGDGGDADSIRNFLDNVRSVNGERDVAVH